MKVAKSKGIIFDIQRYSIHDGPGIRSLVFFKGCPLSCKWCCNPESQSAVIQLMHSKTKCKLCGRCVTACTKGALSIVNNRINIDRTICDKCGDCISACYHDSLKFAGKWYTLEGLMDELLKDEMYFIVSGGGVTIGGGEPLFQQTFLKELIKQCHNRCLCTAIETCGYIDSINFKTIIDEIDMLLMDLKHMNDKKHIEWTGVSNKLILKNWEIVSKNMKNVVCRVPIIPGFNDNESEIKEIVDFISSIGIKKMHLLPYHRLGENKYELIGANYFMKNVIPPSNKKMDTLLSIAKLAGLNAQIGG